MCVYITTERSEFCTEGYKGIGVIQGKNGRTVRESLQVRKNKAKQELQ
jgi:hypothetical protein